VGRDLVALSPMEFAVLECLLRHAGKVVTREDLLAEVWAPDATCASNRADVYMHYLRRKLSAVGLGDAIRTMRGAGYVLDLE
jgi:DNA-binding response OmpR family regulator